jgi:hypothetical protein
VFLVAGVWGIAVVTPLSLLFDEVGARYPPPITHPDLYYGFVTVTLALQAAFLVISRDPVRFRALMIPAIFEKLSYGLTLVLFHAKGRLEAGQAAVAWPDLIFGVLFIAAYTKTDPADTMRMRRQTYG